MVGTTGAQGVGSPARSRRAGVVGSPRGRSRATRARRPPGGGAPGGVEVVQADLDDESPLEARVRGRTRRVLHDEPLGAPRPTRRSRRRGTWRGGDGGRHPACDLVVARGHAPEGPARTTGMPTLQEKYKVLHFDAKGVAEAGYRRRACQRRCSARPSTGRTSSLRPRPEARRKRHCSRSRFRWGTATDAGDGLRGHRQDRARDIQGAGDELIGETVGSRAST